MFPQTVGATNVLIGAILALVFTCLRRLYMFITGRVEEVVPLPEEEQVPEPNVEITREVDCVNQIRRHQLVRIEVRRINELGRQQLAKAKRAEEWAKKSRLLHERHDCPVKLSK